MPGGHGAGALGISHGPGTANSNPSNSGVNLRIVLGGSSGRKNKSHKKKKSDTPPADAEAVTIAGEVDGRDQIAPPRPPVMNMAVDPHEPRYCYCHQVSYGDVSDDAIVADLLFTYSLRMSQFASVDGCLR